MLMETFMRKQLGLKAHTVTRVEETGRYLIVHIDRLGGRLLRCGVCRQRCRKVHSVRKAREWRDLSMRKLPLKLRYRPRRVQCPRCGLRVEDFPWAEPWARVSTSLSNAVASLARDLSWQATARHYGLNWKSVATIVKRAVAYGLRHRARPPVHVIGIDEVSRRKGQVYLTVVYDLERRVWLWVGEDRTEEAVKKFFTEEMGKRRCRTLRVVCMDMWAAYANLVREHAPNAQILFDRFHIVNTSMRRWMRFAASYGANSLPRKERPSKEPAGCCSRIRGISPAISGNGFRHWSAGTRPSSALTTSKKPFNCSGFTNNPNGPGNTWRNGCVRR
jgi:transposase